MKDKAAADLASQMKEARELLEEGDVREALVLAMDVLWRELDQLRDSLQAVQDEAKADQLPAEPFLLEAAWPEPPSQLFH